jgi:uncharacterized membrane protein
MQPFLAILVICAAAAFVLLPIWLIVRSLGHDKDIDFLQKRIRTQEGELDALRAMLQNQTERRSDVREVTAAQSPVGAPGNAQALGAASREAPRQPVISGTTEAHAAALPSPVPVVPPKPVAEPAAQKLPEEPPAGAEQPPRWVVPAIDWEQFMGAKLFAWLGGLALFLGVAFFVKYSFEHELIPPQVRVALGFLLGAGLVVGGLKVSLERYRITAQTLVASGIVSLYAVTFACDSVYHFAFFGPVATFLLMALITAAAFLLAVRLEAQVVAILGILGGFLTPILVSTGHDNPAGLFCYIGLLVIGLVAVALHRGWNYLVPLGAAGTVLMLVAWTDKFYAPEKTVTAMVVCLGFCAIFLGAAEAARRLGRQSTLISRTAILLPGVAFCLALYFLDYPAVAARAGLLFAFVLLTSLFAFALAWREGMGALVAGAAASTVLVMARWAAAFTAPQAPVVVSVCLAFSAIYFIAYLAARRMGRATAPVLWSAVGMPAVSLAFAFFLMENAPGTVRPGLLLPFIFASDALLLAVAWLDERTPRLHLAAGLGAFVLLAVWAGGSLTADMLPWALAASLAFAALHSAFGSVLERRRPACAPTWWSQIFPPLALLLMLFPVFRLAEVSLLVWPAILLVDVIAIALAVLSASLAAVGAALVLTLLAAGSVIFKAPADALLEPSLLLIIGGFSVFFFGASFWLVRRLGSRLPADATRASALFGGAQGQLRRSHRSCPSFSSSSHAGGSQPRTRRPSSAWRFFWSS